mmetsp:Transcript_4987/g.11036  ORF Transcript_4987/g.11036 Transcript_4987/m.11036 type:complete len:89 (+) Transcript_4987:1324-1590(+)
MLSSSHRCSSNNTTTTVTSRTTFNSSRDMLINKTTSKQAFKSTIFGFTFCSASLLEYVKAAKYTIHIMSCSALCQVSSFTVFETEFWC